MTIGITCYPTYGGSGAVATELGLELARRGHEVHFISYASPFRLRGYAERVTFHEVTQTEYPLFEQSSPYALALAVKQHEVAMRENLDLMHVHYAIPHAATAWLAKQMLKSQRDLKIVTTLHGTDITLVGQDPSYYTLTKFSIEQSDRVTAVSTFLRDETYRAFGCAGCDVIVIPNFISTAEYPPPSAGTCRHSLAPPDHKVLVHVSNFRPVKRVTDVVRVFAGVRREVPATLVLVGDGPERDAAEQEVDRLELRRDVRFLGKVDDVAEILRGSDLFLLPSETESFGLAALEAMACAVPVLASAVGGLPEVVVHGETGFLTPKGDVEAMIAHGLRVLRDGDLQARMREAAARRALARRRPRHARHGRPVRRRRRPARARRRGARQRDCRARGTRGAGRAGGVFPGAQAPRRPRQRGGGRARGPAADVRRDCRRTRGGGDRTLDPRRLDPPGTRDRKGHRRPGGGPVARPPHPPARARAPARERRSGGAGRRVRAPVACVARTGALPRCVLSDRPVRPARRAGRGEPIVHRAHPGQQPPAQRCDARGDRGTRGGAGGPGAQPDRAAAGGVARPGGVAPTGPLRPPHPPYHRHYAPAL